MRRSPVCGSYASTWSESAETDNVEQSAFPPPVVRPRLANPRLNATPTAQAARTNTSFLILPPLDRRLWVDIVDPLAVRGEIAGSRPEVALVAVGAARSAVVHDRIAGAMVREAKRVARLVLDLA